MKRPSSLTDLTHAHEEQEVEFLKLQVAEQRGIIDELTQVRTGLHDIRSYNSIYSDNITLSARLLDVFR